MRLKAQHLDNLERLRFILQCLIDDIRRHGLNLLRIGFQILVGIKSSTRSDMLLRRGVSSEFLEKC